MTRVLNAKLSVFIQNRIPLTADQIAKSHPTAVSLMSSVALEGILEHGGNNTGTQVNEIQSTIQLLPGASWCDASQQTNVRFAELMTGATSPLAAEGDCVGTYRNSPKCHVDIFELQAGDLIVFQEIGDPLHGHIEMIHNLIKHPETAANVAAICHGGNTSSGPGLVNPPGADGYFAKIRSLTANAGSLKVLGFLRPFP